MSGDDPRPTGWGRRRLLRTGAAVLGGTGAGWTASAALAAQSTAATPQTATTVPTLAGIERVPFHGARQAGVTTTPQAHLSLLGLDLLPDAGPTELERLLRLLSDDAARLTQGDPALADTEPELAEVPARLTVTLGFGPRVVTGVLGLEGTGFRDLPAFSTDRLQERWGQTDLVVQVCADDAVTVTHARRMLMKDARPFATLRWVQDGHRRARGSQADGTTMRNLMGQVDGTTNPTEAEPGFDDLVWVGGDSALAGGTFLVVRRIDLQLDQWDRVDRLGRESVVGRRLDTGAPLTGTDEFDEPDYAARDAFGFPVIDPASHIARARSTDPTERFLRRGYNASLPVAQPVGDGVTQEESSLLFLAFAADVDHQFVPVQRRLAELDRLNEWTTTIGSAVYAVPPGASEGGYVGQGLVERARRERGARR